MVIEYLDECGEEWRAFVDDELKKSNENNNKVLGGQSTAKIDDDDEKESGDYDVQMEKIMARFTNFNQILSQGGQADDDDDDDCDEDEAHNVGETDDGHDEDDEVKIKDNSAPHTLEREDTLMKVQKVEIKEPEPLEPEFVDNNYWKLTDDSSSDYDVDSLLAELEA